MDLSRIGEIRFDTAFDVSFTQTSRGDKRGDHLTKYKIPPYLREEHNWGFWKTVISPRFVEEIEEQYMNFGGENYLQKRNHGGLNDSWSLSSPAL
jgi:hypothetical protein